MSVFDKACLELSRRAQTDNCTTFWSIPRFLRSCLRHRMQLNHDKQVTVNFQKYTQHFVHCGCKLVWRDWVQSICVVAG